MQRLKKIGIFLIVLISLAGIGYLFMSRFYPHDIFLEPLPAPAEPGILPAPETGSRFSGGLEEAGVGEVISPGALFPSGAVSRAIIYEARLGIEVSEGEVRDKASQAIQIITSLNGYVGNSWIEEERATLYLKVPNDKLNQAIDGLKTLGEVEYEEMTAYDVTDQLVDLEARLNNSRATEKRLLQILEEAETVDDIILVEDRLSQVREEIERLEAMMLNLQRRIDYSSITLSMEEKAGIAPEFDLEGLLSLSLRALYFAISLIVVGTFFVAPVALVGGVALLAYKRYRERRSA